ncbi:hypothetical protein BDZ97DRAFT_1706001 [Flammula alnicola]|nr:hypothetical protein BDZ97DRAFT_1706001 [Flammula alnicola]
MGSGQSKYYRANQNQQYPYAPPPPPPPLYPGQYNPQQPFIPGYGAVGYAPQMYPQQPQGFIPPGIYGQGAQLPPPLLNWLPQDRRKTRRSRRRESDRFVGGFAPGGPQQQEPPPRRTRSESHRRDPVEAPVIPPVQQSNAAPAPSVHRSSSTRRAPTPFIPAFGRDEEDDREDRPRGGTSENPRPASRQSARYSTPSPIQADFAHVVQPLDPASSAAFGPTGPRPRTPLRNPLPPPPRDIYEMTPYKSVLALPQTTALLTATYGPQQMSLNMNGGSQLTLQPTVKRKKSAKGLFRAFSRRDKKPESQPQVRLVPVFVPSPDKGPQSSMPSQVTPQQTADLIRSLSQQSRQQPQQPFVQVHAMTGALPTGTTGLATGGTQGPISPTHSSQYSDGIPPIPPVPSSPPALRFDQDTKYAVFMNHSPHRVMYRNLTYPTALHLHEALKFIDHRPDLAEAIRKCPDIHDVYPLAAKYQELQRPDWNDRYLEFMEEVLTLKFKQHADLRILLLGTGSAKIIYSDAQDTFWGSGLHDEGQNQLGKSLVRVRDKLRAENLSTMLS